MDSLSLVPLLQQTSQENPDRIAFQFGENRWTYAEFERATVNVAAGLMKQGIQQGDRVAFLLPNSPELVFLNLACLKIGAIAVPMNTRLKGDELAYILKHCKARACFVHIDLYPNLARGRDDLDTVESYFVVGTSRPMSGCRLFEDLTGRIRSSHKFPTTKPEDVAAILYTSGTTARPKGVTHTHRSLASTVTNFTETIGLMPGDIVFGMLSMSHIFGYTLQLLAPLSVGATVVAAPRFEADHVLKVITHDKVTHLFGLPVMFDALSRQPLGPSADVKSLKYCLAGGDAVSQRLNASMYSVLGVELHEGCGMTEVLPYALNRLGIENRVGSIGKPSNGINLRLVDGQGADVAVGEVGEILVKSDSLTVGYWEDPESTSAVLRDGWFHTGDLGRQDEDGYYWFVGRSKEIIVRGGSNISPLEVEAAVSKHPAVREVAVIGVPHPVYGESVAAFVVLKEGASVTEAELKQFASQRIADYKVPEQISFVIELPRGTTGKIHRKALKEKVESRG